jgi:hypothetical protein
LAALLAVLAVAGPARADLAIETETARVLPPGHFELGYAAEFQTSPQGQEYALPMAFEIGVIPRLEALIEPVAFTSIQPKGGKPANGIGDLEATLTYLAIEEQPYIPAIAVAGEVKFPTATARLIGSGKYDYRLYGIASKRIGDFDFHVNLGYNIIGAPRGTKTRNPIDAEFAVEWFVNEKWDLFAEFNYIASSAGKGAAAAGETTAAAVRVGRAAAGIDGIGTVTSEIAGEQIIGSVGARYHLTPAIEIFGSFSYDNTDDKLFRTGMTFKF